MLRGLTDGGPSAVKEVAESVACDLNASNDRLPGTHYLGDYALLDPLLPSSSPRRGVTPHKERLFIGPDHPQDGAARMNDGGFQARSL